MVSCFSPTFSSHLQLFTTIIVILLTLRNTRQVLANSPPVLAEGNRTYRVFNENQMVCLYASFQLDFYLYRVNKTDHSVITVSLPEVSNGVTVHGICGDTEYQLSLEWTSEESNHFNTTLKFVKYTNSNWTLRQILFTSEERFLGNPDADDNELRTFSTNNTNLFNRTFHTNQYFYCKGCKIYYFTNENGGCNSSVTCSYATLDTSIIYLGSFNDNPDKQVCIEDWIAIREMIIPIIVGSVLGVLLIFVLLLYIAAFIKRKISEREDVSIRRQYKRLKD